jgi:hypothetical protein
MVVVHNFDCYSQIWQGQATWSVTNERSEENLLLLRHLLELPINDSASKSEQKSQVWGRSLMMSFHYGLRSAVLLFIRLIYYTHKIIFSVKETSFAGRILCIPVVDEIKIQFFSLTDILSFMYGLCQSHRENWQQTSQRNHSESWRMESDEIVDRWKKIPDFLRISKF